MLKPVAPAGQGRRRAMALLAGQARRRRAWQQAATRLTTELVSAGEGGPDLVARQVRAVSGADAVAMAVMSAGEAMTVQGVAGKNAAAWRGVAFSVEESTWGAQLQAGRAMRVADPGANRSLPALWRADPGLRSLLFVPMPIGGITIGVLTLASWSAPVALLAADADALLVLAEQAALALELGRLRAAREQGELVEDRDRIARDLHDQVIRRLFALGLHVQSLRGRSSPEVAPALSGFVDELDETIRQVRSTIFDLRRPAALSVDVQARTRILDVLAQAVPAGELEPQIELRGPLDELVTGDLAEDVLAVLGEALTNVVRHATATSVRILVEVDPDRGVRLVVADDGSGLDVDSGLSSRSSGLRRMHDRAVRHGGSFSAQGRPGAGTTLDWAVPLPRVPS